jgi:phosphate transport system permease protein
MPMGSLPLVIFNYATSPYDDWQTIAWGASLILLIFILTLNILIKVVISKWNVKF